MMDTSVRESSEQLRRRIEHLETMLEQRSYELLLANEKLSATVDMMQEIFQTMPGALLVLDRHGIIDAVNDAASLLLGYAAHELVGRPVAKILEAADVFEPVADGPVAHSDVLRTESLLRTKSGALVPVLLSAATLVGPGRRPRGTICVALDLRDRRKLEAELRQAQKLEAVGRLAAGIAHEINTPVQFVGDSMRFVRDAMRDLVSLIERYRELTGSVVDGQPPYEAVLAMKAAETDADLPYLLEQIPAALERSLEGLERVASIVRSMKAFAHPDRREMTTIDLNRTIECVLTMAFNEYKYVADVETDFEELPPLTCHAGEINQAILNIVVNAAHAIGDAVKGTERRGRIVVRTRAEPKDLVIAIADDGPGIPPEIQDRVFDPFFTTKEVGRGTGQGLAIARTTVERHGGSLTFETEQGKGTTFIMRLPRNRRRSAQFEVTP